MLKYNSDRTRAYHTNIIAYGGIKEFTYAYKSDYTDNKNEGR